MNSPKRNTDGTLRLDHVVGLVFRVHRWVLWSASVPDQMAPNEHDQMQNAHASRMQHHVLSADSALQLNLPIALFVVVRVGRLLYADHVQIGQVVHLVRHQQIGQRTAFRRLTAHVPRDYGDVQSGVRKVSVQLFGAQKRCLSQMGNKWWLVCWLLIDDYSHSY